AGAFRGTPLTITAENANVQASNRSARVCGRLRPIALLITASTAKTAPPSGSVAYVLTSPIEFAFASCRLGTRLGSDASRAGVQSSEKHSITNDRRKM